MSNIDGLYLGAPGFLWGATVGPRGGPSGVALSVEMAPIVRCVGVAAAVGGGGGDVGRIDMRRRSPSRGDCATVELCAVKIAKKTLRRPWNGAEAKITPNTYERRRRRRNPPSPVRPLL